MNYLQLIDKMHTYTISAVRVSDLAIAANKLMSWNETERKTKPRLSTASNIAELENHKLPLCLEISDEMSILCGLIYGKKKPGKNSVKLHNENDLIPIEQVISTQVILYNYCLLEEYEFNCYNKALESRIVQLSTDRYTFKDYYERGIDTLKQGVLDREQNSYERKGVVKRTEDWGKIGIPCLSQEDLNLYEKLSIRRNELTHVSSPKPPSLNEALGFFHCARVIARSIATSFKDESTNNCCVPWEDITEKKN